MKRLFSLLPFIALSCTTMNVTYNTKDIKVNSNTPTIPIFVEVHILDDSRASIEDNASLYKGSRLYYLNGHDACINAEKYYERDSVSVQISKMLVDHFNDERLFKWTFLRENMYCNYYLSGSIRRYFGEQVFSNAAYVGYQFGLLGKAATAGLKTSTRVIIEIADLKLYKKNGELVKDFGTITKEYSEDMQVDGSCWCVYYNVNEKFKDFNAELVKKIRADLADIRFE
jgi:hypothetical protein